MSSLAWPLWAWACWAGAAILITAGLFFLYRGLWRDKHYRTRRCSKCWYEMTGTPGLRCPECGREAKNERALFRRRRSRWWAALGLTALLLAFGLGLFPKVSRDGWWTVTPDAVLIWLWPGWIPEWQSPPGQATPAPGPAITGVGPGGISFSRISPATPPRQTALQAVTNAINVPDLSGWERRMLARRCGRILEGAKSDPLRPSALGFLSLMGADAAPAMPALMELASTAGSAAQSRTSFRYGVSALSESDTARMTIKTLVNTGYESLSPLDPVWDTASPTADQIAAACWAKILKLDVGDPIVARLVTLTRKDPMIFGDRVVQQLASDPAWTSDISTAVAEALRDERESPARCADLLVALGPQAQAALPVITKLGGDDSRLLEIRRVAFSVICRLGPLAQTVEPRLEKLTTYGEFSALLASQALSHVRGDREILLHGVLVAIEIGHEWSLRHEASRIAAEEGLCDPRILSALLAQTKEESTLMQARGAESLKALADKCPEAQGAIEVARAEGGPRAREVLSLP